ncbi:hypothetical protein [Nocardioides sp. NPDC047086]|uniref:hypothetical protein n=1 Tax=Nocardioides sp. NPDC047086 TaxID=3154810 RepID=UPI0033F073B8
MLRVGGKLAKIAEPARLLAHPVDDFVADFVGRDRGYRGLGFQKAPELPLTSEPTASLGDSAEQVRAAAGGEPWTLVVDDSGCPLGWVDAEQIAGTVTAEVLHRGGTLAATNGTLRNLLDAALSSPARRGVVVDEHGAFLGTVLAHQVLDVIESTERTAAVDTEPAGSATR